MALVPN